MARALLLLLVLAGGDATAATGQESWTGDQIMQAAQVRARQFPHVYEEQSILLVDANGARDTRRAQRYSRIEEDGRERLLLVFETPPTVRGVAMLAERTPQGDTRQQIYLPALGGALLEGEVGRNDSGFMGTDFTVESLTGEVMEDFIYERGDDLEMEGVGYFTVSARARGAGTLVPRRHFVRMDNFFIVRTDYFNDHGELVRSLRAHDLQLVDGSTWQANVLLMDDYREKHRTVIRVTKRVLSRDYVPEKVFTEAWLQEHYPAPVDPGADAGGDPLAQLEGAP